MQFFLNGRHQATLSDFDTEPLVRSIIISLFSWKRAGEDDVLPGKSRMGWWADSYNDDEPPIGSKLWLLSREVQHAEACEGVCRGCTSVAGR